MLNYRITLFLLQNRVLSRVYGVIGDDMKNVKHIFGVFLLFSVLIISGCGKNPSPTPQPTVAIPNNASWLSEQMQVTQSDFTIELISVVQDGSELVATVKYPLRDWRNWYISKINLDIGHEFSYSNPGARLNERLYQKGIDTYCLQKAVDFYEEKCISSSSMEPYQTVDLIFSGVPEIEEGTQLDLIIQEWLTTPRNSMFCDDLPLLYIEETVAQEFPGLKLECTENKVKISSDTEYADDTDAKEAVDALVAFAADGRLSGWWEFEFNKITQ